MFALVWHVGILVLNFSVMCVSNQFQCLDGKTCIPTSYRCDGVSDCEDNSDEHLGLCEGRDDVTV